MLGQAGDWLVELAASWTIVMILTGLYMWWPRPFSAAGTFWPRLGLRGRPLLKDLHRVTGFWIAGLVLIMLASGLPWAGAWGSAFAWVRAELGWVAGPQGWKIGVEGGHADHHAKRSAPTPLSPDGSPELPLAAFVDLAHSERMAFPVMIYPPRSSQRFGPPTGGDWTVRSEAQNRTLARQITHSPTRGIETGRQGIGDQHVLDRVVNTGVAWHEGQLFGWANQLIGLLTALALMAVSLAGVLMWLKRRPGGALSPPPEPCARPKAWVVGAALLIGILLPLFALSALVILGIDLATGMIRRRLA